jgi:nicotinate-nucleotide adenylyltransferase
VIALFGGSFDPPHLGHAALVRAALTILAPEELWVIPAGIPVHRELSGRASGACRLGWLETMFADEARIRVCDWEVRRDVPSPTIDTLRRMHGEYPGQVPLWLIGMDAFAGLEGWVGYPMHRDLCNMAVFSRQGEPHAAVPDGWREIGLPGWQQHPPATAGHVVMVEAELPQVSATTVRRRAVAGESLAGLVDEAIRGEVECFYGRQTGR